VSIVDGLGLVASFSPILYYLFMWKTKAPPKVRDSSGGECRATHGMFVWLLVAGLFRDKITAGWLVADKPNEQ
jgi:hypothetical protein